MATESTNISIIMLERMWELLSGIVADKTGTADAKLEAAIAAANGVGVVLDTSGATSAANAINAISAPTLGGMTSPGTPATLPTAPTPGTAPAIVPTQMPALGDIDDLGDYGAPPVFDETDAFTMEGLRNLYDNDRMEMLQELKNSFTQFMDQYFPPGGYFDKATDWLERALEANGTGIPIIVESAMWERDRARLTGESARAEDEALTAWASRGYTLPPGALVHGLNTIRAGLTNALSTQSRDIAIKVTDVHVENARFAVGQAAQIRSQAIGAAVEYVKALMVSPQYVGQWLGALIDGKSKLVGAQADVYRTRAGVATDVFKVGAQTELEKFKTTADVALESAKTQNATGLEVYRVGADVNRQQFAAELDLYRTSEQFRLEHFKTVEDRMLRYFEGELRAATAKGELLTRSGELAARVSEANARIELDKAKMQVDAAMEAAKMIATQCAAALNNMQLSASASNQSTTSGRM